MKAARAYNNVLLYTLLWNSPLMASAQFISLIYNSQTICIISARCCVSYTHTKHSIKHGWMYYILLCIQCTTNKALSYYHHNSLIMARHALSICGRWQQPNNLLRHLLGIWKGAADPGAWASDRPIFFKILKCPVGTFY